MAKVTELLEHHRRVRDTQAMLGDLGRSDFVELYDALAAAQKRIEELEAEAEQGRVRL